jgi:hypothetical protein
MMPAMPRIQRYNFSQWHHALLLRMNVAALEVRI